MLHAVEYRYQPNIQNHYVCMNPINFPSFLLLLPLVSCIKNRPMIHSCYCMQQLKKQLYENKVLKVFFDRIMKSFCITAFVIIVHFTERKEMDPQEQRTTNLLSLSQRSGVQIIHSVLNECPAWFFYNHTTKQCECYNIYRNSQVY